MSISRRGFFKGLAGLAALAGFGGAVGEAWAEEPPREIPKDKGTVGIEWLGHGSFLFVSPGGKRILFDPWISTNPMCPGKYKKDGAFDKIDMVLWTHGHVDHFMLPDAQRIIREYNPKVISPWELNFFIKAEIPEADTQTFVLGNKGAWADFNGIRVCMVHADHSSGAQLTGFQGTNRYVGEPVGYMIDFENGLRLYHAGDTALFGDMETIIGDYYKPHVAILPIGGVFTMGPEEAAMAVKKIRPLIAIPEHYMTFPALVQSADGFVEAVRKTSPGVTPLTLEPGKGVGV